MLRQFAAATTIVAMALLCTACSSGPSTEPADEPPSAPSPVVQPEPTGNIVVSDAVPTMQELRDMGISDESAECFIETIDPENTGRVSNVDLFMEAFSGCL